LFHESGATYVNASRRFLFRIDLAGCSACLHTVIFNTADPARQRAAPGHAAVGL
jgi:hypothetical protein